MCLSKDWPLPSLLTRAGSRRSVEIGAELLSARRHFSEEICRKLLSLPLQVKLYMSLLLRYCFAFVVVADF
jgi:hypothetical protein